MDAVFILFIRACKSSCDSEVRVRSIYRRFYTRSAPRAIESQEVARILLRIAEDLRPMSAEAVVTSLKPDWWGLPGRPYWERVLSMAIGRIACTERRFLPDNYIPQLAFRNRHVG